MDLNKFIAALNKTGTAKQYSFDVLITRTTGGDTTKEADMKMRIEAVDFPGRSLNMTDSNYAGMPYKIVTGSSLQEIPISIILSENFAEKEYMEAWQDVAVGKYRKEELTTNSFSLGYYKDYIGTVDITQYNDLDKAVYRCKLIDAFPSAVGIMSASWQNNTEIHRLPVQFSYRYYKIEDITN